MKIGESSRILPGGRSSPVEQLIGPATYHRIHRNSVRESAAAQGQARGSLGKSTAGVTLVEMMMVVVIVAFIVGISFPAVSSGLENIRLSSSTDTVASFLNGALNRAERRQEPVELIISARESRLSLRSADGQIQRQVELAPGVTIGDILPGTPEMNEQPRHFIVMPGGVPPAITVELANRRGERRRVRVDPITGAPEIDRVAE